MEEFLQRATTFQVFLLEEMKFIEAPDYLHISLSHSYELLTIRGYDSIGLYSTQGTFTHYQYLLNQFVKCKILHRKRGQKPYSQYDWKIFVKTVSNKGYHII